MNLGAENVAYLNFLQKLTSDIIDNPNVAGSFLKNPEKYLADNGIKGVNVNLDEGMLKLVTMLADKEICQAIKANDFGTFLNLCKKRNLVSSLQKANLDKIIEIVENNRETLIAVGKAITQDGTIDWEVLGENPFVFVGPNVAVIPVVVLAYVVMAVGVAFFGAVAAAGAGLMCSYALHVHKVKVTYGQGSVSVFPNPDPHIIQIWTLKNVDSGGTYIVNNEYDKRQIDDCVNAIYEMYPEQTKNIDKEKIKQLLALNISMFYKLYENSPEN